jgi:hypothetical protein
VQAQYTKLTQNSSHIKVKPRASRDIALVLFKKIPGNATIVDLLAATWLRGAGFGR